MEIFAKNVNGWKQSTIFAKILHLRCLNVFASLTYTSEMSEGTKHAAKKKLKFSINDFFSKCDQIRRYLRIWLHLLKNSLMENFIFCVVTFSCHSSILRGRLYGEFQPGMKFQLT